MNPEQPNVRWVSSYACHAPDTYLGDPEVFVHWRDAFKHAQERLLDNIGIDLGEASGLEAALDEAQRELNACTPDEDFEVEVSASSGFDTYDWVVAVHKVTL